MEQHEQYAKKKPYFWFYTIGVFALATIGLILFTTRGGSHALGDQDKQGGTSPSAVAPAPKGSSPTSEPGHPQPGSGIVPGSKEATDSNKPATQ